jgi:peptidoglycan/LPS O-acetylase OafA/YrhL
VRIGAGTLHNSSAQRVEELDGIRAIAILLVLIWHYGVCQIFPPEGTWAFDLKLALGATWSGVDLFFVLSGFLIGGILIDTRGSRSALQKFFFRRACRILPLYFLVLGVFLVITALGLQYSAWLFDNPLPSAAYLTFTQNFFVAERDGFGPHWLGVTWSLAVEEQFYLVVPFLVAFAPRCVTIALLVLCVAMAPFVRAVLDTIDGYVLPFARMDSLLLGVLCAYLVRSELCAQNLKTLRWGLVVLFVALGFCFAWATMRSSQIGGVENHFVFALFYACLILLALAWRGSLFMAPLRVGVMRWLAARSYAIYLFHQLVSGTVHVILFNRQPAIVDTMSALATFAALCLTFVLAEVSYRALERPFQKLGARFGNIGGQERIRAGDTV